VPIAPEIAPARRLPRARDFAERARVNSVARVRDLHHNVDWPASFPAGRPMLALDRIYSRGADVLEVKEHDSAAARKASDNLPVVAEVCTKSAESHQ
jgi:endonuclease/exonuclease/phosphatase family metal-dependent hydrolase